jgi:transposase
MAILNARGKLMQCLNRDTSEESLIEEASKVTGKKHMVVEECHLAQWVHATLKPYVDELTVCDPKHNRWIAQDDFADDRTSAIKLAQLAQMGQLKPVYHPDDGMAQLRGLFLHYYDLTRQLTRFKNKLKACFRRVAVPTPGRGVYHPGQHQEWLEKLRDHPYLVTQAQHLFELVDRLQAIKAHTHREMVARAKRVPAFDLLTQMPGIGPVVGTGYLAIVITPHRFARKNKLWRYAGLANQVHESDGVVYRRRPSRCGNRVLKWIVIQHFQGAVRCPKGLNRFQRQYQALLARGVGQRAARRVVCRTLLSVVRAVWMTGEPYQEMPLS